MPETFPGRRLRPEHAREPPARPEEAGRQRALLYPQGAGGFAVWQPDDLNGDERIAKVLRQGGDGFVDEAPLGDGLWLGRGRVLDPVELVGRREGGPAARPAMLTDERVAEDAKQVSELVVVA